MTFRKNLFVMLSAVFLVVIGALLMDIRMPQIVDGLTLVIPTVAMALLIEDLWRKILTAREKLTWQYFLGEVFVVCSGLAWLWASTSADMKSMGIRLGVVFLLGLLGGIWFALCYHPSVQSPEEREQEKWARFRAKIKREKKADAFKTLAGVLRFRLLGDDLSGDLDFDRPLAVYHEELLTYEEAMAAEPDGNGNLPPIQGSAHDYLQMLVSNLPE